ncbi:MAG: SAM-dependent methyltransferase [Pseudomonadota bacterium]
MTPLARELAARITQSGPMPVSDFMAECLLHPVHGYYTTAEPFGTEGDFITAPDVSQMFGEMVGVALAQAWMDQGAPESFVLGELGPGRGTLMADIWRATKGVPGFQQAAQVALVEASPKLRATQAKHLADVPPSWHDNVADLPQGPLFLVANEFFDALPIRQFVRGARNWQERCVGLVDGELAFGLSAEVPYAALNHRLDDTRPGDIVEICPSATPIVEHLTQRLVTHGGAVLIIDYGGWRSLGDTLQAVHRHTKVPPLTEPGQADLTAHVDFEALATAAAAAEVTPMVPQGVFLERLGITTRAQNLARGLSGEPLQTHVAAHRRLTHPAEMGSLFKALGITAPGSAPFPGLSAWP